MNELVLLPIILPLLGAIPAALLHGKAGARVAFVTAALTLLATLLVGAVVLDHGPQVYAVGGWSPPYGIALVVDRFSTVLATLAALVATASALHALAARDHVIDKRLYHALFLLLLAALCGVFYTGDLFNLYVFMELVILSSFALVALAERPISAEVTFKYAVISAIGSAMLLAGVGLVYAGTGSLNMADMAQRVRHDTPPPFWSVAAGVLMFAFLLKGGIFPFHFWLPDAHSAAPTPVSAMLSAILVKVGIYGIVRTTTLLFPETPLLVLLAPLGAVSAVFGGLAALANGHIKRLLAYSSIANVGLILLAVGWGGTIGLTAAVVHLVNHALIKSSLFLTVGYVTERLDEEHRIARLGGLAQLSPRGTALFGVGVLALAGLPPLNGFISKWLLFQAGYSAQHYPLLVLAVGGGALSIVYSLRGFVRIFWGDVQPWAVESWTHRAAHGGNPLASLLLVLLCVLLGVWPGPLIELAQTTAQELIDPAVYMTAVLRGNP